MNLTVVPYTTKIIKYGKTKNIRYGFLRNSVTKSILNLSRLNILYQLVFPHSVE